MAHVPVLTQELLRLLDVHEDSRVVDCTFGAGGHAEAVAARLGADGLLIACDRDPVAEDYYLALTEQLQCPSRFYPGNFAESLEALVEEGERVTHVYMDLGVSSMQIDTPERGFSYSYDAPLDMRMDPSLQLTAADILNGLVRSGTGRTVQPVRGGAVFAEDRAGRRKTQNEPVLRTHLGAGRHNQGRHSHARPLRGGQSRTPGVPGSSDRSERRAGESRYSPSGRLRPARERGGPGRDQLPLPRGSHRQGLLQRQGQAMHLSPRLPRLRVRG